MLQKSQVDRSRLSFTWGSKIGGLPRITTQWDSNLSTGSIQSITVKNMDFRLPGSITQRTSGVEVGSSFKQSSRLNLVEMPHLHIAQAPCHILDHLFRCCLESTGPFITTSPAPPAVARLEANEGHKESKGT